LTVLPKLQILKISKLLETDVAASSMSPIAVFQRMPKDMNTKTKPSWSAILMGKAIQRRIIVASLLLRKKVESIYVKVLPNGNGYKIEPHISK
jgi:hypothetical protein